MSAAFLETMESLTELMEQENALLNRPNGHREIGALAAAKLKLTARLEAQIAFLDREQDGWRSQISPEVAQVVRRMQQVAAANGRVLKRQILLSHELLEAIAGEAQRLAGLKVDTYGEQGALSRFEQAAPVAVNARL